MSEHPWLEWVKWQEIKRRRLEASQVEMEEPDDFAEEGARELLYQQSCPTCGTRSVFTRSGETLTFPGCGHIFRVPKKPEDVPVRRSGRPSKGMEGYLYDWDNRTGKIIFDDGTAVATQRFAWTNFPPRGYHSYGEERWQLTTTVPRGALALLPTGAVGIDAVEVEGKPFAVKRAIVQVADADEELERPVITVQWRPADAPDGPARVSREPDPADVVPGGGVA